MKRALALVLGLGLVRPARADDSNRPLHGSASAGGTLLLAGDGGDRQRAELELDVEPWSRFGAVVAWRGFDRDHAGLVTAGIAYEAAASRPRLVVDLHGDLGLDADLRAPAVGGGIRAVIEVIGPLGVALDTGTYLVIDGVDRTRLQLAAGAALCLVW
ncbi:MAG TPA: hypothetical protein VMJ10_25305 [Kofleriaceae bacterium]|nr:hypothetical protein [Kofleriaceae bacterium]